MVKVYALIPKRPDISDATFHAHWRNPHGELAKKITTIRRYQQSHRVADGVDGIPPAVYRGIAEVWFDDVETAVGMGADPNYTEHAQLDEANFIDVPQLAFLLCAEEHPLPGPTTGMDDPETKVTLLLRRAAGVTPGTFAERLRELDGGLAALPGLLRLARCAALPVMYADADPLFDGVVELAWPDPEAVRRGWDSARDLLGALAAAADLDVSRSFVSEPYRVIWP